MPLETLLDRDEVPTDEDPETLDVRDLPPPKPLSETLERLGQLAEDEVLVQVNDRVPQHLFPQLDDRGYDHATAGDDPVYTAIWKR